MRYLSVFLFLLTTACVGIPDNVQPINQFDLNKYLGKWYEVARLDHSFERGLSKVTAEYSLREDGGVRVMNKGYDQAAGEWKSAEGKAYFVQEPSIGFLKVSFFGPFYGSYIIFELDQAHYQYAVVSGPDTSYLWILARSPNIPDELKMQLAQNARGAGFDTTKLIWVEH